jgi:ABC-type transport system involved in multi-copper enzyme maturation permease subunit
MPVADPVRDDRTNVGPKGTVSMQFWALLKDSIRESLDRKIFWVVLAATLLVVLGMASIGFDEDRVSLCFGLWETTTQRFDPGTSVGRSALIGAVIFLPMQLLLGWVGLILILIATAGFFPTMMEPGAADVLLTKPISRPRLFIYKYACSLVFVLLQASAFVVLTFVVMGVRWGVWAPGYLLSVPLLVLLFSYVYCVSVLVAVKTRSTVAAILLSLAAWALYAAPREAVETFEAFPELQKNPQLYQAARALAWVPPKTGDVLYFATRWAGGGTALDVMPPGVVAGEGADAREQMAAARRTERERLETSPWLSIGSSLAFESLVLLWAAASFTRRDF